MTCEIDLFGAPVDPGTGKPGRPRKVASTEDRNKVKLLLARGWNNQRIADVVRMSLPTFRRLFFHELKERDMMRDRADARIFELTWTQAETGNLGAIKEIRKMMEADLRLHADHRIKSSPAKGTEETAPIAPARLGKKEAAKLAANNAGGAGTPWDDLLNPGFGKPN